MTQNFEISLFKNKKDNKPELVTRTWEQLCERFQQPQIRKEKDGALFSPAVFNPALRCKENVKEISLLVLDIDHNADVETIKTNLTAFDSAYAIYSTHSHLRQTVSNPNAEPRFRVCLPLASAIPAKDFPALWQYVKQTTGLPLDESAKDVSRMFYTPAIAASDAPYHFEIKDGAFLEWQNLPLETFSANGNGANQTTANNQTTDDVQRARNLLVFEFHEDRHAELCKRVEAQAKATGRGTFEMKCPVHNGNGNTSLFYDPTKQTVACIKKPNPCGYFEILHAFGLSNERLPNREKTEKKKEVENKPLAIIRASEVVPKKIQWLWHPYIPKNYVTLFSGEEGVGKSWVFCAIASGITHGFLPLTEKFEPQNVLIFSAEDAADDALVPRLIKCEADLSRVFIVNERFTFDEKGLQRFEHYIAETNPVWVIIDPLFAYSDLKLDLNKQHHARFVATSIEQIAKKFSIAISYLIHFNKSKGGGDARAAVSSSQEFSNAARSILLIGKDPNDETRRALIHRKHNYSPKGKAIGYQILGDKSDVNFFWLGESTLTENEIVGTRGNETERGEQSEAVTFLRNALADERRKANDVIKEAETLDISKHKLRTARAKLGIQPYSEGYGKEKTWFWELPKTTNPLDANSRLDASLDARQNGKSHLRVNHSDKTSYDNNLPLDASSQIFSHLSGASKPDSHLNDNDFCPECETRLVPYQNDKLMCEVCLYTKAI